MSGRITLQDNSIVDCNARKGVTHYFRETSNWGSYTELECLYYPEEPSEVFITSRTFEPLGSGFKVVSEGFTNDINMRVTQGYSRLK
jgi:hypothetical protein